MTQNRFSIPLQQIADRVRAKVETVARTATLDLFRSVVDRSPVGNPELWAANREAVGQRTDYLQTAITFNAENPNRRRKGVSRRVVEKKFPLLSGKGYIGGRFKSNWNFSVGAPDGSTTESTQQARGAAEAQKAATGQIGSVTYLTNGLPYARRLEFEAWSTQAPAGMVRVSVVEFDDYLRKAIAST